MTIYAQILDGKVINVVELDEAPQPEFVGYIIDVTNEKVCPKENWNYNNATSTISEPNSEELIELKERHKGLIDGKASAIRRGLVTGIFGQSEIYAAKTVEANEYISNSYPSDTSNYPWLELEIEASGLSPKQAADIIKSKHDTWNENSLLIELQRRKGKINIDNAVNYDAVLNAHSLAITALENIKFK